MESSASRKENIFFTRKSDALRSILLMTRRPSATTDGMAAKSESNSTICETWHATSLPEAIATLQSAALSAKTSLTPSPVMATVLPSALSACTSRRFCSGVTRPKTVYSRAPRQSFSGVSSAEASTIFSAPGIPASAATCDAVTGLSPEITLISTFCAAK